MNFSTEYLLYINTSKDHSTKDYSPGGMVMPERSLYYEKYRFGFNNQEKDDEIQGSGNSLDFGERIYDPRLGKFLSVDFLTAQYPWYSPYQFAGNTPIQAIDLDGLEPSSMVDANGKLTAPMISLLSSAFVYSEASLQSTTWVPYTKDISTQAWASMVGIPSNTSASVMGTTVVHDDNQNRSNSGWFGLIAHEQSHESDIEKQGTKSFYVNYLIEGASKGYHGITTEQNAYSIGGSAGQGYAGQLFRFKGGAVMQTLNDANLTDALKSSTLESIGSKFRRDVILQDQLNSNRASIQSTQDYLNSNTGLSNEIINFNESVINKLQQENAQLTQEQNQITKKYGE